MKKFFSFSAFLTPCKFGSTALVTALLTVGVCFGFAQPSFAQDPKVKRGLELLELNDVRGALINLRNLVAADPQNPDAHAALAMAMLAGNDATAAEVEAQKAFNLNRKSVLARTARAMVWGKQGKIREALGEFQQALKLNDKEIGTYLALSRYYLSLDSLKQAEVQLYRAQAVSDKDVRPFLGLGELYEKQKIPALAISQYESALQLDANDVTVMAKLAGLYFRNKKYNESITEWIKILRMDSTYAQAYYEVAYLYYLAEQYGNAVGFAERYTQLEPNDIQGYWLMAQALTEAGQYARALVPLEKVSTNDSLKQLSQLLLARSYFFSKDPEKALTIYRAAQNLDPKDLDYYGRALMLSGDTLGGIQKLQLSLVNDTIRSEQTKLETMRTIASTYYQLKKFRESAKIFMDLAAAHPAASNYQTAAEIYLAGGFYDEALDAYQKAISIEPNSPRLLMGLAQVYSSKDPAGPQVKTAYTNALAAALAVDSTEFAGQAYGFLGYTSFLAKDYASAITNLEKSVDMLRDNSPYKTNFLLMLAQAYHSNQKTKKAEEYYGKVLKRDPGNKSAREGLQMLKGK